jgi:hypothetical protein
MSITITTVPAETTKAIALVGTIVTWCDDQYTCYSVEGYDYYAFQSAIDQTTVDFQMTPAEWLRHAEATLLPMGAKISDGTSITVKVNQLRRGVCLVKQDENWGKAAY